MFAKYAVELERERRALMVADMAIASQGNSKGIMQKVKELLG
ncbi:MAG: hypothetical protein QNJ55_33520 [Xenococcus sp. MO_188.B8]|nr:hypothetical protein [Xenococcus sp. MO_188.B8]